MQWLDDHIDVRAPFVFMMRSARWTLHLVRRYHLEEALSWLLWLFAVLAFAWWVLRHYQAPAGPIWIGQTVRTAVFAIWTQVVREYIILRWLKGGNNV